MEIRVAPEDLALLMLEEDDLVLLGAMLSFAAQSPDLETSRPGGEPSS